MEPGYIYILKNPALREDLLKIGMTTRSPHDRIAELSNVTGVPAQFELKFVEWVPDCREAEQLLHECLVQYRYAKEFFSVSLEEAIALTRVIADTLRGAMTAEASAGKQTREAKSPCISEEVVFTDAPSDETLSDDLQGESSYARPPDFSEELVGYRATERQMVTCSTCGEVFWVTFKRYEDSTVCPRCHTLTGVAPAW